jgi:uncharacterized membrane protein
MGDNFPKYILAFLGLIYLMASIAEIVTVKGGTQLVFESVKTFVPHMMTFILGFYFSRKA